MNIPILNFLWYHDKVQALESGNRKSHFNCTL